MQNISRRIVVIGTGGTIAGTAASQHDHTGYTAGQVGIGDLLRGLPGVDAATLETEQVAQLDSKDMDHATWQRLAQRLAHHLARDEVAGAVVVHGTDTLEETAWFLQRVLAPAKPVVLTAAMRPASALNPDGPQNLIDAVLVAGSTGARGVVAVIAGQVIAGGDLRKLHPYRLDAFGSGDGGPLGVVEQGRLRRFRDWPEAQTGSGAIHRALSLDTDDWPWVEIVTSRAGVDQRQFDLLVDAGVDGIVIAATGNGTVHRVFDAPIRRALDKGIAVVRSTRCVFGGLIGAEADSLLRLDTAPPWPTVLGAGPLSPVQARIELMLALLRLRPPAG
ncbi:asparaginase [Piscinibacter sakaiensis]|uniref:asparaginase n=1 Tax=Piscinibacter sakaiensis TaxID=1547922 RepID=UPI003AAFC79A